MNPNQHPSHLLTQPLALPPDFGSSHSITTSATKTETTASHNLKIKYTTCAATSQSPAPFENGEKKNTKFGDKSKIIYEFSTYNTSFFSPNQSVAFSDSRIPSNTITVFKMWSTVANFAQKHRKVKNSSHYSENFTVFFFNKAIFYCIRPAYTIICYRSSRNAPIKGWFYPKCWKSRNSTQFHQNNLPDSCSQRCWAYRRCIESLCESTDLQRCPFPTCCNLHNRQLITSPSH